MYCQKALSFQKGKHKLVALVPHIKARLLAQSVLQKDNLDQINPKIDIAILGLIMLSYAHRNQLVRH